MQMQASEDMDADKFRKTVDALENYLPSADDFEESDDLEILKRMKGK